MASSNPLLQQQKQTVSNYLETLRNEDLRSICRIHGRLVSGNKPVLVTRCQSVLDDVVRSGDIGAFEDLKSRAKCSNMLPSLLPAQSNASGNSITSWNRLLAMANQRAGGGASENRTASGSKPFKSSPFYDVQDELLRLHVLPEMPQNRNTVRNSLIIRAEIGQKLRADPQLKILIYCRETHDSTPQPTVDIKFPNQIEIKVNNNEVKHNFKGLKTKPGSTKPADITSLLQRYNGQENSIHITYALTTKHFSYGVYLARYVGADKLVDRIKAGNVIPKDKVLREMTKSTAESDIVATSFRLSLKDPVSTVRISLPVRSSHCEHNQCFDGAMFLQLQEQAPQWNCPVCNKHVAFESLCVDKYFEDILNRTSKATEKVEIQPNGVWRAVNEDDDEESQPNGSASKARASYDDDFDDLIKLDEPVSKAVNGLKRVSFQIPSLSPITTQSFPIQTPPLSSREASVAQSASSAQRPGNKRPQSTVIDLTLSDEDEDETPGPAKRHSTIQAQRQAGAQSNSSYNTPTSLPDPRFQPSPPQPQQTQQHRDSFSAAGNVGQANAYRSAQYAQPTSTGLQQRRQSYTSNSLNLHPSSVSPSNHTASPFSPHTPSPAWPQYTRPATAQQQQQQQQIFPQQQAQSTSFFPSPSSSFPLRPPSAPSAQNMQSNSSTAMHSGLRLPPRTSTTNGPMASFSPDMVAQDAFQGWRDGGGGAFENEWDSGNFDSSPT